ncbi:MAG: hypothetical protein ACTHLW_20640 [Verrucomicrobiota bacterium]
MTVSETFFESTVTASGNLQLPLEEDALHSKLKWLSSIVWTLSVSIDGQESPHSLSDVDATIIENFLQGIRDGATLSPKASVKLFIEKNVGDGVDVFSPEDLFAWLNSLEIQDALDHFHRIIGQRSMIAFLHPSFAENPSTNCFKFCSVKVGLPPDPEAVKKRDDWFLSRREQVVSDWSALRLFSDDFRWKNGRGIAAINGIFAKLENFLSVMSLADSTTTTENGFIVRVKSHVLREETVAWSGIPEEPDIPLRNLFGWCYRESGSGPLSDKLGLVRNYISLYWEGSVFGQDERVVAAVRAGFGMYLKRNLKEFVEIRAKVAAFLLELDAKASKAVESATGNLEKNLYGVVTFVTSVVLIKVLQDKTFTGAFSSQVALLGWTLIGFSALHAVFAWRSTDKEMDRATELYDDLKKLYDAFFSEKDFDSIFSSQGLNPIQKTNRYVRSRLVSIMIIWGATLFVAAGLIWYLKADTKSASAQPAVQASTNSTATATTQQTPPVSPKP